MHTKLAYSARVRDNFCATRDTSKSSKRGGRGFGRSARPSTPRPVHRAPGSPHSFWCGPAAAAAALPRACDHRHVPRPLTQSGGHLCVISLASRPSSGPAAPDALAKLWPSPGRQRGRLKPRGGPTASTSLAAGLPMRRRGGATSEDRRTSHGPGRRARPA